MEIIVILVVALLVLGPAKLPDAARQVGKAFAEFKRVTSDVQNEMRDALSTEVPPSSTPAPPTSTPTDWSAHTTDPEPSAPATPPAAPAANGNGSATNGNG